MTHEVLTKKVNLADSILYYQIDIMKNHPEIPLLPMYVSMSQHFFNLQMDISGKISLASYLADHELSREEWIHLLIFVGEAIQRGTDCFLDSSNYEISLSTIYLPSDRSHFVAEDSALVYIPVLRDTPCDPARNFCIEVLQFLSAGIAGSSFADRFPSLPDGSIPACEEMSGLFSTQEAALLMSWSVSHLEDGLVNLRNMLYYRRALDSSAQKSTRTGFLKNIAFPVPFKNNRMKARIPEMFQKPKGYHPVLLVLVSEIVLILAAFRIMRLQARFMSPLLPVLLLSGILLCFCCLDLFLLFSRKSFLHLEKRRGPDGLHTEDKGADTVFRLKEEKTVLLDSSSESRRIAMISSGIPGTLEESTGLKAYILVDDFLIGRDQTKVDFKISSLSVGRIHARITRRENSFFIEDLNSRNGTFLDQKRLKKKEEYLLPENCKLRFAENEFYFVAN